MTAPEGPPVRTLKIIRQGDARYLFNRSGSVLRKIRLAHVLISAEAGFVYPTSVYKIENLPPESYTSLPKPNKTLDGYEVWRVETARWTDGNTIEEPVRLSPEKKWGGAVFSEEQVSRPARTVRTDPERKLESTAASPPRAEEKGPEAHDDQ